MSVRRRVFISGDVQGVFFRDSCRREARGKSLGGWVRNLSDGRVEAVFEGDPARVDEMIRWCHQGPPHAQIEAVDVTEEPPEGETEFSVR